MKMQRNIFITLSFFLVICIFVIILAVWPKPEGGELFSADFKNGFDLYIEDSYALLINSDGWPFDSPHSIRRVAHERLKSEILKLCKEIASYRELDRSKDVMSGAARLRYHPRIYLDTGSYCYRIEIFNWDNYSGKAWADYPVRQERFGEPVLHVKRIDLSHKPESEASYSYAKNHGGPDSLNNEGSSGWYSIMSQEHMDELLSLVYSVGEKNAEIVWSTPNDG